MTSGVSVERSKFITKQSDARILWRGDWFCSDQVDEKLGPVMESFEADPTHEPVEELRVGRRPKFTEGEDLILVREVAAAKAHVAGHG
jgi:hypothetical protein